MASEIKANKLSPATGTDVTLGDSSDTFTAPSGVTIAIASGATITNSGTATGFGDANTPYFHATTTADSAWGAASYTTVVLNSVVAESNTGSFDTSTYRFTVPAGEGGTYFTGGEFYVPSAVGAYYILCKQNASGTELNYSASQSNGTQNIQPAWIIVLAAGDYLEWSLYGGSGTTNGGTTVWGWKLW